MIDISFLKPPANLSGMEFLDWQNNSSFYDDLTEALSVSYSGPNSLFTIPNDAKSKIESIITKYSNLNVTLQITDKGNLGIDTGYINPNNLLNIPGIENWMKEDYSSLGKAFKQLKTNVIKGWCDSATGKVEGDYKKIPFTIFVNPGFTEVFNVEALENANCTIPEAYAAFILHECGHAFSSLYFISQNTIDNLAITKAAMMYGDANETDIKTTIIKDLTKTIQTPLPEKMDIETKDDFVIAFSKQLTNRNLRRCLSMGVAEMTSEVLADAYAIRFGASHGLIGGLAAIPSVPVYHGPLLAGIWASVISVFFVSTGVLGISFTVGFIVFGLECYITKGRNITEKYVPGSYNTPYRRIKTVIRENITNINNLNTSSSEKAKMIKETKRISDIADENKPFLESTAYQRLLGWITSGSDFRKTDFEHYTEELTSSVLALYNSEFFIKD